MRLDFGVLFPAGVLNATGVLPGMTPVEAAGLVLPGLDRGRTGAG